MPPLSPGELLWAYVTFKVSSDAVARRLSSGRRLAFDVPSIMDATLQLIPNATNVLVNISTLASGRELAAVSVGIDRVSASLTPAATEAVIRSANFLPDLEALLGTTLLLECCSTEVVVLAAPAPPPALELSSTDLGFASFGQDTGGSGIADAALLGGIIGGLLALCLIIFIVVCLYRRGRRKAMAVGASEPPPARMATSEDGKEAAPPEVTPQRTPPQSTPPNCTPPNYGSSNRAPSNRGSSNRIVPVEAPPEVATLPAYNAPVASLSAAPSLPPVPQGLRLPPMSSLPPQPYAESSAAMPLGITQQPIGSFNRLPPLERSVGGGPSS